jgi:hypothetical protein
MAALVVEVAPVVEATPVVEAAPAAEAAHPVSTSQWNSFATSMPHRRKRQMDLHGDGHNRFMVGSLRQEHHGPTGNA